VSPPKIPCLLLAGSGYVSGELLRLLALHPVFEIACVVSTSRAGEPIESAFPHLAGLYPGVDFAPRDSLARLFERHRSLAAFAAGPHGASASLVDSVLSEAERLGVSVSMVDLSADFRFPDRDRYERVYGTPHGAPERLARFRCSLPEHFRGDAGPLVAHPGCFTTSVVLAAAPLVGLGLVEPEIRVSSVTGSTGSGSEPRATTHHPFRHANLFAYQPLSHRHEPEMRHLISEATGIATDVAFVPHSGPFARGIHTTIHARLARRVDAAEAVAAVARFYDDAPFVTVTAEPPRIKDVVGTNRCRIGLAVRGDALVALSVIDNLVKGAAGGAIQWMNRLVGLEESAGLLLPGLGWS
jgi:N-acetyl-gamma-glutamyl-phosphate reductase